MGKTEILLESGTNELELVEFYIDEILEDGEKPYRGHYGVNIAKVLEIIRIPEITQMPDSPHPCVLGAFNLRGRIIPLIDLSIWLKKKVVHNHNDSRVIVTEFNNAKTAFLVSGVNRIHRLSWKDVEPPGNAVSAVVSQSITGVVNFPDHLLLVLDMEKVLADLSPSTTLQMKDSDFNELDSLKGCKAVIADDSPSIKKLIDANLQKAGFDVNSSVNGEEAWNKLLAYKEKALAEDRPIFDFVDIIISDIEMPVMDGHNLTKRIKEDKVLKDVPVILFSSLISNEQRHRGEKVGADAQITKPEMSMLTQTAFNLIRETRK